MKSYRYNKEEKRKKRRWVDKENTIFRKILVLVLNVFVTSLDYNYITNNTYI